MKTTKKIRYYYESEITGQFHKLSKKKQAEILWDALDYMQQYNGRSKFLCVAMAMGYVNNEGDHKSYYKPTNS
jgi:hypothetical protein